VVSVFQLDDRHKQTSVRRTAASYQRPALAATGCQTHIAPKAKRDDRFGAQALKCRSVCGANEWEEFFKAWIVGPCLDNQSLQDGFPPGFVARVVNNTAP
jgi:hypothetical protein